MNDPRIPIRFADTPGEEDAFLVQTGLPHPATGYVVTFETNANRHAFGCACCNGQSPAATALTKAFRARATGTAPFFRILAVIADEEGEAAIMEALERDITTAARYRLMED